MSMSFEEDFQKNLFLSGLGRTGSGAGGENNNSLIFETLGIKEENLKRAYTHSLATLSKLQKIHIEDDIKHKNNEKSVIPLPFGIETSDIARREKERDEPFIPTISSHRDIDPFSDRFNDRLNEGFDRDRSHNYNSLIIGRDKVYSDSSALSIPTNASQRDYNRLYEAGRERSQVCSEMDDCGESLSSMDTQPNKKERRDIKKGRKEASSGMSLGLLALLGLIYMFMC